MEISEYADVHICHVIGCLAPIMRMLNRAFQRFLRLNIGEGRLSCFTIHRLLQLEPVVVQTGFQGLRLLRHWLLG